MPDTESLAKPPDAQAPVARFLLSARKRYAFHVEGAISSRELAYSPRPSESTQPLRWRRHVSKEKTHRPGTGHAPSGGLAHGRVRLGEVLPRYYFLEQLRREKRRTERTKTPLSIVLFHFREATGNRSDADNERLRLLHRTKRETDVLGYLERDLIAIVLPDTNQQGTQRFIQKVTDRVSSLEFSITFATYPDQVFNDLAKESEQPLGSEALFLDQPAEAKAGHYVKRAIDLLGALAALTLASPIMLIAAILVATTSPGPVLFKQVRLGKRGRPFVFYKFRSMYRDADSKIHRDHVTRIIKSAQESGGEGNAWSKLEGDPRITRVGRFLRKTSIDELPQLFSVLKGDMSLVGPRPPLPYEGEAYQPWHLRRVLDVKPGITGLWQVTGRGTISFDDMVRLDLRYIGEWSLMLDLKILLKTVLVVLKRQGAT